MEVGGVGTGHNNGYIALRVGSGRASYGRGQEPAIYATVYPSRRRRNYFNPAPRLALRRSPPPRPLDRHRALRLVLGRARASSLYPPSVRNSRGRRYVALPRLRS